MRVAPLLRPRLWLMALLAALVATVCLDGIPADAATRAMEMRVGQHADYTRFVIELGARLPFKATALAKPDRIAIDFPALDWQAGPAVGRLDRGVVWGYRLIQVRPNVTRIELTLARPGRILAATVLPPQDGFGPRFVLDVAAAPNGTVNAVATPADWSWNADIDLPGGSAIDTQSTALLVPPPAPDVQPLTPADNNAAVRLTPPPPRAVGAGAGSAVTTDLSALPAAVPTPPASAPAEPPPAALETASLLPPLPAPAPGRGTPVIPRHIVVIDAGHGGQDPGAIGLGGVYEKNITLATALLLRDELNKLGGYEVHMTRSTDVFLPLRDRVDVARHVNADLFISLHADSIPGRAIRGASIYTLSNKASDKEAELLAQSENRADIINGEDLSGYDNNLANILIDLAQESTMRLSRRFASLVVTEVRDGQGIRMLENPQRQAGFVVLKAPDVPSVLIEMGFLSSDADLKRLTDDTQRDRLAAAIATAVQGYFTQVARLQEG
ncbi:N-acetylmuramoyl-L-alanine amidase [Radicibacter daui]|uniref:N-acetylmuramoyl-L-alanine amidase n=1 Tax=Radicibacter daui TaxID=3064829 RepID=UPI004046D877